MGSISRYIYTTNRPMDRGVLWNRTQVRVPPVQRGLPCHHLSFIHEWLIFFIRFKGGKYTIIVPWMVWVTKTIGVCHNPLKQPKKNWRNPKNHQGFQKTWQSLGLIANHVTVGPCGGPR